MEPHLTQTYPKAVRDSVAGVPSRAFEGLSTARGEFRSRLLANLCFARQC